MTPQLWVFAGPNGAGKTTLARRYVAGRIEIVNPDEIARQIEPQNFDDSRVVALAGRQAVERRRALLEAGETFGIETTLTGRGALAFMAAARERGFKINLVFVGIKDAQQSFSRVGARVQLGGHSVPDEAIARRFNQSMANLPKAMKLADRALVFDNTGKRRRLILSREKARTKGVRRSLPQWALAAIPAAMRRVAPRGVEL